jgi:hypothetical protein
VAESGGRGYAEGMENNADAPRTEVELLAISLALARTGGEAPAWLKDEMQAKLGLPAIPQDPDAYRWHMKAALSAGALLVAFIGAVDFVGEVKAAPNAVARPVYVVDEDARDAISLVQQSTMAGDETPVLARLGGVLRNADGGKAWSAEKTDEDSYLVIYREPAGFPAYAFEVDLESGSVQPTPEAVDALALLRVRGIEEQERVVAAQQSRLVARAN